MGYYSRNYYPVYEPRSYLISAGNLGVAFPVALGAKVAKPDKAVVVASGDGGFLYNSQELATAVQYGINVVVIVFNDNAYGNVLRAQIEQFDGHVLGTQLYNPDFVKLAEAYGVRGVRVHDAGQLGSRYVRHWRLMRRGLLRCLSVGWIGSIRLRWRAVDVRR